MYLMERDCCASGRADVAIRLNRSLDDILCDTQSDLVDAVDGLSDAYQFKQLARLTASAKLGGSSCMWMIPK